MRCRSYAEARQQAQANADQTGARWCAFFDTSGNAHCERLAGFTKPAVELEVFYPMKRFDELDRKDAAS
jgi:hypothetical protein